MANIEQKISLSTPKGELYALWRDLQTKQEDEMRSANPQGQPKHDFLHDFYITQQGLDVGEVSKSEVDDMLRAFKLYRENSSGISAIAGFWYELSLEYREVDGETALSVWRQGLEQEKDIYLKVGEMPDFVGVAKPADGKEMLETTAEQLREALPSYEVFPIIFPADEDNYKKIGKKFTADALRKVSYFVRSSRGLGVEISDLDDYLLGALEGVDLSRCDGYVTKYLISHLVRSRLPAEEKRKRLVRALEKASNLPRGLGFYDTVLEGAVDGYLYLNDLDTALLTWREIEEEVCSTNSLNGLIRRALMTDRAEDIRQEFGMFKSKFYEGNRESAIRGWNQHWFLVALSLTTKGEGFFLNEPEAVWWIKSRWVRKDMGKIWNLCLDEKYKDKTEWLRELVLKQVGELIDKFNASELGEMESEYLLEALMAISNSPKKEA